MHLAVFGGSGFIGSEICRQAIGKGWRVTSISRSGQPLRQKSWHSEAVWIKADIKDPETYKAYIRDCNVVCDSVGLLFSNYNQTMSDINAQSCINLAKVCIELKIKQFVHLSADRSTRIPFLMDEYFRTKQQAEEFLLNEPHLEATILRPNLVYSPERPISITAELAIRYLRMILPLPEPLSTQQVAKAVIRSIEMRRTGLMNIQDIVEISKD